jgi:hypothetical protein
VIDRLLARERGEERPAGPPARPGVVPATREEPAPAGMPHADRRMLVIAGLGSGEGRTALRAAARWGLRAGRRPAVLELGCAEIPAGDEPPGEQPREDGDAARLPLASVPCAPERLRGEPPDSVAELVDGLRRHESASDLLLVRIPPRHRALLLRGALLAGGIVLPLDGTDGVLHAAFRLSQEVLENFVDLALWPFPVPSGALERYLSMMQDFLGMRPRPLGAEMEGGAAFLDRLPPAPEEGFVAALLSSDRSPPPARLLQTGYLRL